MRRRKPGKPIIYIYIRSYIIIYNNIYIYIFKIRSIFYTRYNIYRVNYFFFILQIFKYSLVIFILAVLVIIATTGTNITLTTGTSTTITATILIVIIVTATFQAFTTRIPVSLR